MSKLDILDAGRWTGSAKNSQPWDLIVVQHRPTLEALAKCGQFAGHLAYAPLAIALVMSASSTAFAVVTLQKTSMGGAYTGGTHHHE